MNRICLSGRLTKDLELRCTGTGKDVVSYTLAVRRDKDNTDFINCSTFGEMAKVMDKYCHKGDMLGIEGRLIISKYDKDGETKYNYNVISDRVDFLQTKKEENDVEQSTQESINKDEVILTDDDLPF